MNNRVIIAVTNDLSGDQRVHKVAMSLINFGYQPILVGRALPDSRPLQRPYPCRRFRLLFRKGPLFYAEYTIRLFLYLMFSHAGWFLANDLDTLPAVYSAGRLRKRRIVYDSHEYFTEVPELVGRDKTKRIWERIERRLFPRLKLVYTVNSSIAAIYSKKYGVDVKVVRNLPSVTGRVEVAGRLPAGFEGLPYMIYQGALNIGRGLEELIAAVNLLPDCRLLLAGDGDKKPDLERLVSELGLGDRVRFTGRMPFEQLAWYTRRAVLGISLEQDLGLNYHFALPNKLFDYMTAGIPVLASDLPEIRSVVEEVGFGMVINRFDPGFLSDTIAEILADSARLKQWSEAAIAAAPGYVWEREEEVLREIFADLRAG